MAECCRSTMRTRVQRSRVAFFLEQSRPPFAVRTDAVYCECRARGWGVAEQWSVTIKGDDSTLLSLLDGGMCDCRECADWGGVVVVGVFCLKHLAKVWIINVSLSPSTKERKKKHVEGILRGQGCTRLKEQRIWLWISVFLFKWKCETSQSRGPC